MKSKKLWNMTKVNFFSKKLWGHFLKYIDWIEMFVLKSIFEILKQSIPLGVAALIHAVLSIRIISWFGRFSVLSSQLVSQASGSHFLDFLICFLFIFWIFSFFTFYKTKMKMLARKCWKNHGKEPYWHRNNNVSQTVKRIQTTRETYSFSVRHVFTFLYFLHITVVKIF